MAVVFEKPKSMADVTMHYCPGCTHGIIHRLVCEVIDEMGIEGDTIGICPVGCSVMAYDYFNCDMIEAAHGRAPAVATGVKRTNPDKFVFTYQGDGDLADEYLKPAMRLADGLIGQKMEPVTFPEKKESFKEKPWAANGHGGKREHNIINSLYLQPDVLENSVKARFERYEEIKATRAEAETYLTEDADIIVTAYGATARVAKSAVNMAREQGIKAGLIRPITLWPFPVKAYQKAAETAKLFLCAEMSMGQMIDDVKLAINCSKPVEFYGRTGGVIPKPSEIFEEIKKYNGGAK